jgi:hypothetical protein
LPLTHLVGSWLIAVAATGNPRDRKRVTPEFCPVRMALMRLPM